MTACGSNAAVSNTIANGVPAGAEQAVTAPRFCSYAVQKEYPHDPGAFTEGLFYDQGELFESTGLVGRSFIRKVRLADGKVMQQATVPAPFFGEGIAKWKNELISLTWRNGVGLRWDASTLRRTGQFAYTGEGWGLTQDGRNLIMSDGSTELRFLDPSSMKVERTVSVAAGGQPVANLNELEWVDGAILANVWMTDQIVSIDPATGNVRAIIDLTGLREKAGATGHDAVLNGIAYDAGTRRLFVTGKNWPKLFQITLRGC